MVKIALLAVVAIGIVAAPFVLGKCQHDTAQTAYGRRVSALHTARATFGAGCFWGVEAAFRQVPGVVATTVGYTGGTMANPTYEQVCAGGTGHTESVEVVYDPKTNTYDKLLEVFWRIHDPAVKHKTQYKSVIFYHTPEQRAAAEAALEHRRQSRASRGPIATEILPAAVFYPAEAYHQQYYEKRGIKGDVCAR